MEPTLDVIVARFLAGVVDRLAEDDPSLLEGEDKKKFEKLRAELAEYDK